MNQTKSLDPKLHELVAVFLTKPGGDMTYNCNQARWRLSLNAERTNLDATILMEIPGSIHEFFAWKFWWDLEQGYQNRDVHYDVASHEISVNWSIEDIENEDSVISLLTAMQQKLFNVFSLIASRTNPSVPLLKSLRTKIHEDLKAVLEQISDENTASEPNVNSALGSIEPNPNDGTIPEEILDRMVSLLRITPSNHPLIKNLSRLLQRESTIAEELIDHGNLPEEEKAELQNFHSRNKLVIETAYFNQQKTSPISSQIIAFETDAPSSPPGPGPRPCVRATSIPVLTTIWE
jgi:hypothetical protein